ncbi:MAG: hypothetical protein H0T57_03885 [Rubrobacter sp.]|nr:hypothetical protein [Rubrobacter sp.]
MHQPVENAPYGVATDDLWDRILGLIEQDLEERRSRKLFVEVAATGARMAPILAARPGESGSCEKEIGELSVEERRSLHPVLREHVVERLLDRHLAEQGRVDVLERRHPGTRQIQDLTPEDLPALIEADRLRAEEEYHRGQMELVRETQADLEQSFVAELAETVKEARR